MRTTIIQFDTRSPGPHEDLIRQNAVFAESRGYEHMLLTQDSESHPPYWGKVLACNAVAQDSDAILFLDTDSCVMDFSLDIESLLGESTVAIADTGSWALNAGTFAVRCDAYGREFLREWASMYDESKWERTESGWTCPHCMWAGEYYEQGCLNRLAAQRGEPFIKRLGPEDVICCDHFRTEKSLLADNDAMIADLQTFASAMQTAKIVHFCRYYGVLIDIRDKIREGKVVLYDQSKKPTEDLLMEAMEKCLAPRSPT